jgi:hypothetical protein
MEKPSRTPLTIFFQLSKKGKKRKPSIKWRDAKKAMIIIVILHKLFFSY